MASDLYNKIQDDFKTGLKNKDSLSVSVLRLVIAELKNRMIDKGEELNDSEVLASIKKAVKERNDSITQYSNAGRNELAKKEEEESAILKRYLPEEMPKEEIEKIVEDVLKNIDLSQGPKNFGLVMKEVMARVSNTSKSVDGSVVSAVVKQKLQ